MTYIATKRTTQSRLWTPKDIAPAISAWYDASNVNSVVLNGSTVSQWSDLSGNGNHAVQATSANQPTYVAGSIHGSTLPSLMFNGSSNSLATAGNAKVPLGSSDRQSYVVFKMNNLLYGAEALITYGDLVSATGGTSFAHFVNSSNDIWISTNTYDAKSTNSISVGNSVISAASIRSSTVTANINGTTQITGSVTLSTNPGKLWISGLWVGNVYYYAEINLYESILTYGSTNTLAVVEGYLAWKWGFQGSLPSTHPYKFQPPKVSA